ncbi:MAG: endolytic transglycosylase MltG [Patescibacteria group bacterium]|nr:endolytic transglycosylase MltG [Patescibacteria group bacterium]
MSTRKKTIYFLVIIAMAFSASVYYSTPGSPDDTSFMIEQGESVESISERLAEAGFVRSGLFFKWALSKSDLATRIQPGEHDLKNVRTYDDIIRILASGGMAAEEVALLVREGETLRHIKTALDELGVDASEDLYSLAGEPARYPVDLTVGALALGKNHSFLAGKSDDVGLEGYLFPDTYRIYRDATAEDVIRKMLDNFGDKMTVELLADVKSSGHEFHEIIIMASIIEREVRGVEDRCIVSDIFWRRLEAGMRLQADSTVNYATGKSLPAVSYEDTRFDSPYNTYRYAGLPPGPIGNPGLEAIEAAANPTPNGNWYFLTDTDGNVHYASTLDGHNRNKARYLR